MKSNPNPSLATTSQRNDIEETIPQSQSQTNHDHYTPLSDHPSAAFPPLKCRRPMSGPVAIAASVIFLVSLVAVITYNQVPQQPSTVSERDHDHRHDHFDQEPLGLAQGVSAKSNPPLFDERLRYNWTNAMFSWQRTAFHFQPQKNWMNDPDGPMFYKGWYHLFYQYNPDSAVWGNITWGHAVSSDLIHWLYLPIAMIPDHWYDINGVWTGSATSLPNGQIVMIYTGSTNESVQVQNLAYPADPSDPLLIDWVKYSGNPVLVPPSGIGLTDFRDPTTAWTGPGGSWRISIGSKVNKTGIALVYTTDDFINYNLSDRVLHSVAGTGMWECIDFYPLATNGSDGLDTSANGPGVKHVLKASLDDTKVDHYAIGTYFEGNGTWVPDNPDEDVGIGLRVDYGRYYASKSFYDQNKGRRILWGWVNETDTAADDLKKGWSSLQTIPRNVVYDNKTGENIIEWPVEEIESLRLSSINFTELLLQPGSVVPLDINGSAIQLDIFAQFEVESSSSSEAEKTGGNDIPGCGGATERDEFGPFGIVVLADDSLSELTPIYFRFSNSSDGNAKTYFCADQTRSSEANDVFKHVYGSRIPVLNGENLSMRVLVDHSIVESFGQGGRRVITSRIYPTRAIYGAARLFLFNNATGVTVKANLTVYQLGSALIRPFPLDQSKLNVA